jgi:hypothetical protein
MYAVPKFEFRQLELGIVALKLRTVVASLITRRSPASGNSSTSKAFNHNAVSIHLTQVPRVPTVQFCSTEEMVSAAGVDAICLWIPDHDRGLLACACQFGPEKSLKKGLQARQE